MEALFRFKRSFKKSRNSGVGIAATSNPRPILPPLDYDPMSARTFQAHFDLGRMM